jgi:hypothetical protein
MRAATDRRNSFFDLMEPEPGRRSIGYFGVPKEPGAAYRGSPIWEDGGVESRSGAGEAGGEVGRMRCSSGLTISESGFGRTSR